LVGDCYFGWKLQTAPEICLQFSITGDTQQSTSLYSTSRPFLASPDKVEKICPPPLCLSSVFSCSSMSPGVSPICQRNWTRWHNVFQVGWPSTNLAIWVVCYTPGCQVGCVIYWL
jgi:hypothetical protein